jgi:hypothetical protein
LQISDGAIHSATVPSLGAASHSIGKVTVLMEQVEAIPSLNYEAMGLYPFLVPLDNYAQHDNLDACITQTLFY